MPSFRLVVPASPESVGEVRSAVADVASRAGISNIWAVKTCLSEAVTNAILHGYDGGPDGHISIATAVPEPGVLRVTVEDDGEFRPRSDSPGLGLGLPLIAKYATTVDLTSRPEGGTVLLLEFAETEMSSRADAGQNLNISAR